MTVFLRQIITKHIIALHHFFTTQWSWVVLMLCPNVWSAIFFFDTRSTKNRDKARLLFETQIKITEMPNLCRSNDKPLSYNCRPTIQCTRQGRPLEQTWVAWVGFPYHPPNVETQNITACLDTPRQGRPKWQAATHSSERCFFSKMDSVLRSVQLFHSVDNHPIIIKIIIIITIIIITIFLW